MPGGKLEVASLGRYHPRDRCWLCGALPAFEVELELVVVPLTNAWGWQCTDQPGCEERRRQLRLRGVA